MSLSIPREFVTELQSSGIAEAIIVDDLFESPALDIVVDLPGFWTGFCDNRAAHPLLNGVFIGVNTEDEVQDHHIEKCWEVFFNGDSIDLLAQLFGDYPQRRRELAKLSKLLTDIFGKPTIELVPSAPIPEAAKLVFLDYVLGKDDQEAIKIAKILAARKDRRPYLVLISDSANLTMRSEAFRTDTGYIAGTFGHLAKEKAIDPAELAYSLVTWGLGNSALRVIQPLFDAMISSVDEAAKAVKTAMAAVTIQDYSFLQNLSLSGDGHPLGEYIVDLFGASLSYHFRGSPALKEARALADKTPFNKHLPLSMVPSHLVVELYREALTEPLVEGEIAAHPWSSESTISVIEESSDFNTPFAAAPVSDPSVAASAVSEASVRQVEVKAAECGTKVEGTTVNSTALPVEASCSAATAKPVATNKPEEPAPGETNKGEMPISLQVVESKSPPSDDNRIAWLSTGDIFAKNQNEPLLMVLNAGCDLQFAPNSKRRPQPDRSIFLIEGTLYHISNLQPPDEIARTEYFKFEETLYRINWTDRLRTIKHGDFKSSLERDGYERRIARLSLPYVLQVQQAWLARLGRVGVPVAPPHSGSQNIEIYTSNGDGPVLKKTIPHGVAVFRVKQTGGYSSEFLLSNDTLSAVRTLLCEMKIALVSRPSPKATKKAESISVCLNNFHFWRGLLEKPKPFKEGILSIENGLIKASSNKSVKGSDFDDTRIVLRFVDPKATDGC